MLDRHAEVLRAIEGGGRLAAVDAMRRHLGAVKRLVTIFSEHQQLSCGELR